MPSEFRRNVTTAAAASMAEVLFQPRLSAPPVPSDGSNPFGDVVMQIFGLLAMWILVSPRLCVRCPTFPPFLQDICQSERLDPCEKTFVLECRPADGMRHVYNYEIAAPMTQHLARITSVVSMIWAALIIFTALLRDSSTAAALMLNPTFIFVAIPLLVAGHMHAGPDGTRRDQVSVLNSMGCAAEDGWPCNVQDTPCVVREHERCEAQSLCIREGLLLRLLWDHPESAAATPRAPPPGIAALDRPDAGPGIPGREETLDEYFRRRLDPLRWGASSRLKQVRVERKVREHVWANAAL